MTPREREARAVRVRAFLEDGDFRAAWDGVRADLAAEWEQCRDPAERERLWHTLDGLNRVRGRLASFMAGTAKIDGAMGVVRRAR